MRITKNMIGRASTVTLGGFILLTPFENAATGLRSLLLWLTALLVLVDLLGIVGEERKRRAQIWRAWLGSALAVLIGGGVIMALAGPEEGRGEGLVALVRRVGLYAALLPPLVLGAVVRAREDYPDGDGKSSGAIGLDRLAWIGFGTWGIWLVIASCYSREPETSLKLLFNEGAAYLLAYALIRIKMRGPGDAKGWPQWMIAVGVLIAALASAFAIAGYLGPESWQEYLLKADWIRQEGAGGDRIVRAQFPFEEHNRLGSYLLVPLLLVPLALALARDRRGWIGAAAIPILLGILLTGTRGAMIAGAVGLAVAAAARPKWFAALVVAGLVAVALLPGGVRKNVGTIFSAETYRAPSGNVQLRVHAWRVAGQMIRDRPLFGFGYGWKNYEELYESYDPEGQDIEDRPHAHNNLLEIAAETGLIGAGIFLFFQAVLVAGVVMLITRSARGSPERVAGWALLGLMAGLHAFGMTNYSLRRNVGFEVWMAWGIVHAVLLGALAGLNRDRGSGGAAEEAANQKLPNEPN